MMMGIQPVGGGQEVGGGGTVLVGADRVCVNNASGEAVGGVNMVCVVVVGELKIGINSGVSVTVGMTGT